MAILKVRRLWQTGQRYAAAGLACFCVLGLAPFALAQTSTAAPPNETQDELAAWQSASNAGTPMAFEEFYQKYPASPHLKTVTGTLRGRYWFKINLPFGDSGGVQQDGVIVTVEGMDAAMNLSLADAIKLSAIGSAPVASGPNSAQAQAMTFNSMYVEASGGGVIVGNQIITPKDSLNTTIILSADGSRLLAWDLGKSTPAANPSTAPTIKKGPDGNYPCGSKCPTP